MLFELSVRFCMELACFNLSFSILWCLTIYFTNTKFLHNSTTVCFFCILDGHKFEVYVVAVLHTFQYLWFNRTHLFTLIKKSGCSVCYVLTLKLQPSDCCQCFIPEQTNKNKQTPWPLARERTIPTDRPPQNSNIILLDYY
jgi:hypothetical protein